jgi:hypothetical protein
MDQIRKKASKGVGLGKNKELKHEHLDQELLECLKKKDCMPYFDGIYSQF